MPLDVVHFLGVLVVLLAAARLLGRLARAAGQPAVLGELVAGVLAGPSLLGLVNPRAPAPDAEADVLRFLAELGVLVLLFEVGLEADLRRLLRVGPAAAAVAVTGVTASFALGYAACRLVGLPHPAGLVAGAALAATSVGITARVLADLGRLEDPESQVIFGAAVLDDILGLVLLTVVLGAVRGEGVSWWRVAGGTVLTVALLAAALVLGRWLIPAGVRWAARSATPGTLTTLALLLALGLAWLTARAGSATILGAFAAGLLLAGTPEARPIARRVAPLGHLLVPLFFVAVGATVDLRLLNPLRPGNGTALLVGGLLLVAAVAGKLLAGQAPVWFRGRKLVVGVGMIPRGEVSLIVAQAGLLAGAVDSAVFSAVALAVAATIFLAPPLLRLLLPPRKPAQPPEGAAELLTEG